MLFASLSPFRPINESPTRENKNVLWRLSPTCDTANRPAEHLSRAERVLDPFNRFVRGLVQRGAPALVSRRSVVVVVFRFHSPSTAQLCFRPSLAAPRDGGRRHFPAVRGVAAAACCQRAGVDGRAHETLRRQHVNTRKVVGVFSSCTKFAIAAALYVCSHVRGGGSSSALLTPPRFACARLLTPWRRAYAYIQTYALRVRARCYLFLLSFILFFFATAGGFHYCTRPARRRRR